MMTYDEISERMQDAIDDGLTTPPDDLAEAMAGDDELAALWNELRQIDFAVEESLARTEPAPSAQLHSRIMAALEVESAPRPSAKVRAVERRPLSWSPLAAAAAVLMVSMSVFWFTKVDPRPIAPRERPLPPVPQVVMTPESLMSFQLPAVRVPKNIVRTPKSVVGAGDDVKQTANMVVLDAADILRLIEQAPRFYLRNRS